MRPNLRRTFSSLFCFVLFVVATAALGAAQTDLLQPASMGDPAPSRQIQAVIRDYAISVNDLDLGLARKVWSTRPEVSFIHPRGTERGIENVLKNFYGATMGTFAKRELLPDDVSIHVYGDTAWSEFTWTFHATLKNGGQNITTQGRETQVYRKENGAWRVVHVHYSGLPVTGALRGF